MGVRCISLKLLRLTVLIGSAASLQIDSRAQEAAPASQAVLQPAFDTVSVHMSQQNDMRTEHIDNPSRRGYLRAVNVNLKSLMEIAYDLPDLRMFGGPSWLTSAKFSVEAKADPSVNERLAALPSEQAKEAKRKMIAALLVQRFKLAVRSATRDMPVYALIIAKGGPQLTGTQASDASRATGDQFIHIGAGSDSLQILTYELSWRVDRPVLDETGLQDKNELTLRWRDDEAAATDTSAPSLFTAIQEQLGFKLEATRRPVPVLLIDHAEKPTDN